MKMRYLAPETAGQRLRMMMEGFTRTEIQTSGARIVTVHGGKGPPLLLMHGNPFTHLSWHKFAPRLAQEFTVVATDLRGYGDSSKPEGGERHGNYSFHNMALDNVEVMASLGFKTFFAAGHDRGARVLHRMCLDHPDKVERAAILDIIPQHHLFNNINKNWATFSWHWFFNIQPAPMPEKLMGADPDWFIEYKLTKTKQGVNFFGKEALEEYKRCFRNPATIHAICEDYRACAGIDFEMDTKDFEAGRRIACPSLILWGATGSVGRNSKPSAGEIWQRYATDIRGAKALPCGHYLSEEAPEETYAELRAFFKAQ
jgi:haloacetate dehalogenase